MRFSTLLPSILLALTTANAQNIDTVGGTGSAPSRANTSKSNLFQVDSTVLLTEIEMYLDVPAPDTLTWFVYRHHSRSGDATLIYTGSTQETGGTGPGWYSTQGLGLNLPLVCGNHYLIGVAWGGTVTYHYSIATPGDPVSFGNWQRARTLSPPVPPTATITGSDAAQYYQRLTTFPITAVDCGPAAACSSSTNAPRLVASDAPLVGNSFDLQVIGGAPNVLAIYALADGVPLTTPLPYFNCSVWIDLNAPVFTLTAFTSATGEASAALSVPQNPVLAGLQQSVQAGVLGANVDMTNVLGLTVN